jgi:hypothetical protein
VSKIYSRAMLRLIVISIEPGNQIENFDCLDVLADYRGMSG